MFKMYSFFAVVFFRDALSIGQRSVSADNHILLLDRYSLHLSDLTSRSQLDFVNA